MSNPTAAKEQKMSGIIFSRTPDDLITEFLLRLPVRSVTRFKLVSKSWLSRISNPDFAKSHFAITSAKRPADQTLIYNTCYNRKEYLNFALVDLNTHRVDDLRFPYKQNEFPSVPVSFLVGSAAGIVCVYTNWYNDSRIYLWNPATKQSKQIPKYNIPDDYDDNGNKKRVILCFGYDVVGHDYKVVRVVSGSTEVYSVNRDAWRNVESKPSCVSVFGVFRRNFDVCVNGYLFTAGSYGMITFDLNTEVFNCINFPVPTFDTSVTKFNTREFPARITEFNDSIAAIITKRNTDCRKLNLWALNDEACLHGGVEASWTLMFNIDIKQPVQFVHGHFNRGDILLLVDDVWYLYNSDNQVADFCTPNNNQARNFTNLFCNGQIFRYTESLFSIPGSKQVNWNA